MKTQTKVVEEILQLLFSYGGLDSFSGTALERIEERLNLILAPVFEGEDKHSFMPKDFFEKLKEAVCRLNWDIEEAGGDKRSLRAEAAIDNLLDVAFPPCPGCSEASGSGLAVRHFPPLCNQKLEDE